MKHWKDIDGLRALAVLPVVAFHAGIAGFPGGYAGVDVFFVISGYLITSLVAGELEAGTFSIARFYERRMRRILPALFCVIAASGLVAGFVFTPQLLESFGWSAAASALFWSNFHFWSESGYFDGSSAIKPLLHTWSLAVEEQFYILFPLLLMALWRWWRGGTLAVLMGIATLSFALSVWAQTGAPEFNYYWPLTRFWELLLGAILALGAVPAPRSQAAANGLSAAGVAAILASVVLYGADTPFPGVYALLPCLGTAAVLLAGHGETGGWWPLTTPAIAGIGLISYSLYLWHWPIIAFWQYWTAHEIGGAAGLAAIGLSLVLAYLSWRFVELPVRARNVLVARGSVFATAAAATAAIAAAGFAAVAFGGFPARMSASAQAIYAAAADRGDYSNRECLTGQGNTPPPDEIEAAATCRLGIAAADRIDFILWGDSHATAIAPGLDKAAKETGLAGVVLARASCPPLEGFQAQRTQWKAKQCQDFNAVVLRFVHASKPRGVILVARWPRAVHRSGYGKEGIFFSPSDPVGIDDHAAPVVASLDATLSRLKEEGVDALVMFDVPEVGYRVPEALARAAITGTPAGIAPARGDVERRQALSRTVIAAAAGRWGAKTADPNALLCGPAKCEIEIDGRLLYADEDHVNRHGAEFLSPIFRPFLESLKR